MLPITKSNLPRVLLVDDEPESISVLMSYLRDRQMDISVALGGEDCLRKAAEGQPDLILLDVRMPGLDGFAVCRKLKADPATAMAPVLFLSASTAEQDKLEGFAAGGIDYITKPFSEQEVVARVMAHLATRQRMARLEAIAVRRALRSSLAAATKPAQRDDALFSRALSLLEGALSDPPSVVELAHRLGTNERKLNELFKQRLGMTIGNYFVELRLDSARRLLEGTALQVTLISDRVGYRNAGDFIRAFRRRYGVTPRAYRSSCRGDGAEVSA